MEALVQRDWVHGIALPTSEVTFCRRVVAPPESGWLPVLNVRELDHLEEIDCPTCMPLAHREAREREEDALIPDEVHAMAKAHDLGPFLPLLQRELLAVGFSAVDWAEDVVSRRGFYVVALRKGSSQATPFWIRYRLPPPGGFLRTDHFVQLHFEQPLDNLPQITVTADARFIARAVCGMLNPIPPTTGSSWRPGDSTTLA